MKGGGAADGAGVSFFMYDDISVEMQGKEGGGRCLGPVEVRGIDIFSGNGRKGSEGETAVVA